MYVYIFFLSPILFFYLLFDLLPVATPVILAVGHSKRRCLSLCVSTHSRIKETERQFQEFPANRTYNQRNQSLRLWTGFQPRPSHLNSAGLSLMTTIVSVFSVELFNHVAFSYPQIYRRAPVEMGKKYISRSWNITFPLFPLCLCSTYVVRPFFFLILLLSLSFALFYYLIFFSFTHLFPI